MTVAITLSDERDDSGIFYNNLYPILLVTSTYLHSRVKTGTGECVVVFRVDHDLHNVVGVPLEHLLAGPVAVPVPQLDQEVVYEQLEFHRMSLDILY